MSQRPDRTEMLLQAGMALASELSLDAVLQRIVELAVRITDARYGALGVLGPEGRIADFITVGLTPEQRKAIGHLPVGKGLLGLLIHEARPVRVREIGKDPRSVGFPANHPPMRSFLGAPVEARGRVFGNIYLTEKQGAEEFDEEDERAIVVLANQAGVAIENARLYEDAARREARSDAIREISGAILAGVAGDELLQLVARRARELVKADVATVATTTGTAGMLRISVADGLAEESLLGMEFAIAGSIAGRVMSQGRPQLEVDVSTSLEREQPVVKLGMFGPAMFVPLGSQVGAIGTLMLARARGERAFHEDDLDFLEVFGAQAAVGLEFSRARQEIDRLLVMEDRERIAKELHDGAIQALFAVGMSLQGTAMLGDPVQMSERIEASVGEIDHVIRDLRNYIFGLRPGILADRQLDQALRTLGEEFQERTGILTIMEIDPSAGAELATRAADVVQLCREALSNVARHSGADTCRVSLVKRDGSLILTVDDDGKGFDPAAIRGGTGLQNLRSRAESLRGSCSIDSEQGAGTVVRITVPA